MKNGRLVCFAALSLLLFSCKKKEKLNLKGALVFAETQCADPWREELRGSGNDFLPKLEAWLEKETGAAINKIKRNPPASNQFVCDACSCASGYTIIIWPEPGTEKQFLELGFHQPQ